MKKVILKTIVGGILALSLHTAASAQVSINVNIGSQPAWGPSGYNHVDYYYLPDIESYYDVATNQYIYQDGGRWIFARTLPPRYRGYDLYSGYKVVVNRPKPYLNFSRDRVNYSKYKNWKGSRQVALRESNRNGNNHVTNRTVNVYHNNGAQHTNNSRQPEMNRNNNSAQHTNNSRQPEMSRTHNTPSGHNNSNTQHGNDQRHDDHGHH